MGDSGWRRMRPALLAVVALALVANVKEVESIPLEDGASLDAVDLNQAYSGVYTNAPGQAANAAAQKAAKKAAKDAKKKEEEKAIAGKKKAVEKEAAKAAAKAPAPPARKTNVFKNNARAPAPTPAKTPSPPPPVVKKLTSYGSGVTKQKKVKLVPKFTSTKEKTEKGVAKVVESQAKAAAKA